MGLFENFPYTDMYRLDLDWLIKIVKENAGDIEAIKAIVEGTGLEQFVSDKLEEWLEDGTIAEIINETLFDELNTKINDARFQAYDAKARGQGAWVALRTWIPSDVEDLIAPYIDATNTPTEGYRVDQNRIRMNTVTKEFDFQLRFWTKGTLPVNSPFIKWRSGPVNENMIPDADMARRNLFTARIYETPPNNMSNHTDASGNVIQGDYSPVKEVPVRFHRTEGGLCFTSFDIDPYNYIVITAQKHMRSWAGDYANLGNRAEEYRLQVVNYMIRHQGAYDYASGTGDGRLSPVSTGLADCSSMTYFAYLGAGSGDPYGNTTINWNIGDVEEAQAGNGGLVCTLYPTDKAPVDILLPGDLIVYHTAGTNGTFNHVAMYTGNNTGWDQRAGGAWQINTDWVKGPHLFTNDFENQWFTQAPGSAQRLSDYAEVVRFIFE